MLIHSCIFCITHPVTTVSDYATRLTCPSPKPENHSFFAARVSVLRSTEAWRGGLHFKHEER